MPGNWCPSALTGHRRRGSGSLARRGCRTGGRWQLVAPTSPPRPGPQRRAQRPAHRHALNDVPVVAVRALRPRMASNPEGSASPAAGLVPRVRRTPGPTATGQPSPLTCRPPGSARRAAPHSQSRGRSHTGRRQEPQEALVAVPDVRPQLADDPGGSSRRLGVPSMRPGEQPADGARSGSRPLTGDQAPGYRRRAARDTQSGDRSQQAGRPVRSEAVVALP